MVKLNQDCFPRSFSNSYQTALRIRHHFCLFLALAYQGIFGVPAKLFPWYQVSEAQFQRNLALLHDSRMRENNQHYLPVWKLQGSSVTRCPVHEVLIGEGNL